MFLFIVFAALFLPPGMAPGSSGCSVNELDEWTKLLSRHTWLCFISARSPPLDAEGLYFQLFTRCSGLDFIPAWGPCVSSFSFSRLASPCLPLIQITCWFCSWPVFSSPVMELCSGWSLPLLISLLPALPVQISSEPAAIHFINRSLLYTRKSLNLVPWHSPYASVWHFTFLCHVCSYGWPNWWVTPGGLCPSLTNNTYCNTWRCLKLA